MKFQILLVLIVGLMACSKAESQKMNRTDTAGNNLANKIIELTGGFMKSSAFASGAIIDAAKNDLIKFNDKKYLRFTKEAQLQMEKIRDEMKLYHESMKELVDLDFRKAIVHLIKQFLNFLPKIVYGAGSIIAEGFGDLFDIFENLWSEIISFRLLKAMVNDLSPKRLYSELSIRLAKSNLIGLEDISIDKMINNILDRITVSELLNLSGIRELLFKKLNGQLDGIPK